MRMLNGLHVSRIERADPTPRGGHSGADIVKIRERQRRADEAAWRAAGLPVK